MISLTDEQRVSIAAGATALENHTFDCCLPDEIHTRQMGYVATMRDILRTAEDAPTPDAPPLWRDSDHEEGMRIEPILLELADAPYVKACHWRGGSVLIDDDSDTVAVEPKHLPALIAMLTEVQRRIEAGEAK